MIRMYLRCKYLREHLLVKSSAISAAKRSKVVDAVPKLVSADLSSSTMQLKHFVEHMVVSVCGCSIDWQGDVAAADVVVDEVSRMVAAMRQRARTLKHDDGGEPDRSQGG
jgi:hypothetical protein